jgi:hypothetical protein
MASQNKIIEMIAAIKTIYSYYAKDTDVQMLVKTWTVLLKNYPDDAVEVAFYKCLQTCKMPPTPADVIEKLDEMMKADEPTHEELWNTFTKTLRKSSALVYRFSFNAVQANGKTEGQNAREEFNALWNALPEALKQYLGGSGELIRLSRASDEELKFERTRFFKTMPTIEKRQATKELRLSLEDNTKKIEGTKNNGSD